MKKKLQLKQFIEKLKNKKSFNYTPVKVKKRKPNDNKFGTRKNEGGIVGHYYGTSWGLGDYSAPGDGDGMGDGGGVGESAFYSDESNSGTDGNNIITFSSMFNKDEEIDLNDNEELESDEDQPRNKMGIIRRVKNAHLVFKRLTPDGLYEELWAFNIDNNLRDELEIKQNILAGTDIPPNKVSSPDGQQKFDIWTLGNAQLMHITGLPN